MKKHGRADLFYHADQRRKQAGKETFIRGLSPNRQKFAALEFKEEFRRSAICAVSPTIGINRFDSAHPTDDVTIGSSAENTVRLAIALEADEEWPLTVTT